LRRSLSCLRKKKTKAVGSGRRADDEEVVFVDPLVSVAIHQLDIIEIILGFLHPMKIMLLRRVCMAWKEAARNTIVPPTDWIPPLKSYFHVYSVQRYNAMRVMTRALPNLQEIRIGECILQQIYGRQIYFNGLGRWHKYNDGEDPNEDEAAITAHYSTHDIEIISNFSKLRVLDISNAGLNGRYPFLFNSFPLLQKLTIRSERKYDHLKWDLEMLAGLPLLKELYCWQNRSLTGSVNSLRILKDTLKKVHIIHCSLVEGNFMDLADFPHLKELNLLRTAVTGDIRDISGNDFLTLEMLTLPHGVYGGVGYEFRRISDASDVVRAVYAFNKQRPALNVNYWDGSYSYILPEEFEEAYTLPFGWFGGLSEDSPDRYEAWDEYGDKAPFCIRFVEAGSRIGYRWQCYREDSDTNPCEVNWLDPEPDRESSEYEEYIKRLRQIESRVTTYRGYHQPPTEEEYHRLVDG
jgi:hypothetical protein